MKYLDLKRVVLSTVFIVSTVTAAHGNDDPVSRKEDVIYGRKYGIALTMDVFTPQKANGKAIISVISGGWFSGHEGIGKAWGKPFWERGYTVFAVVHGSQPKFTIPEILADLNRSVRFIRHHASDYGIDPNTIGITGGSAGGHLSLMQATAGDQGDAKAPDPVDRESSRVQAVAVLFPPTDFLNYGKPGENALGRGILKSFRSAFDFSELDPKTHHFVPITDEQRVLMIGKDISPINHVSADDPPTLIIHGDADKIVPLQQSQIMVEKLTAAGVKAKLITRPGVGHGWPDMKADWKEIADWFDENLQHDPAHAGAEK